jgi:hypothetical protein
MVRLIALPLLLITLAACGKSAENETAAAPEAAPSAQAEPRPDACTLVTDEEFQQATGFAVLKKTSSEPADAGCTWELKTDHAPLHRISIDIKGPGGRERFDFMASGSLKKIPDLGDGAVQTGGDTEGTVWALTEDTLVTLRYALPVTTGAADPVVLPLLKLLLSRL